MADYTPTTDQVRAEYVTNRAIRVATTHPVAAEFDRWLEAVKREAKAEALERAATEISDFAKSKPDRDGIVGWLFGVAAEYRKTPETGVTGE